jgi:hypothetical protein
MMAPKDLENGQGGKFSMTEEGKYSMTLDTNWLWSRNAMSMSSIHRFNGMFGLRLWASSSLCSRPQQPIYHSPRAL